jgi:hypothetical protein
MVSVEPMFHVRPTFRFPPLRATRRHLGTYAALLAACIVSPALASAASASVGARYHGTAKSTAPPSPQPLPQGAGTAPAQIASVPGKPVLGRLFAPSSVWNAAVPADARLDPTSSRLVANLSRMAATEVAAGTGPFVQTDSYSTPVYVVGRFQRPVRVAIDTDQNSLWVDSLQGASNAVPIPTDARPAAGTDSQFTIYQPSTDRLWEYWDVRRERDGWHARWGGAIDHVSTSPGYYSPSSWPGALSAWGASATSLPLVAGTMTLAELRAGEIDHALAMTVPDARAGVAAWPAQRSDGTGTAADLPEGAHLRLDPKLNIVAMHLPKIVEMMALAAQRYGIIVRDESHGDIGFFGEDPSPYSADGRIPDPYYGVFRDADGKPDHLHGYPDPHALFDGMWPSTFFKYFPWRSLQVLKMSMHSAD